MVVVDTIKFDSSFSGNQKLVLAFDNVQSVAFRGLHVDEALEVGSKVFLHYPHDGKEYPFLKTKIEISQISVVNVKSLVLESSTFSHLPPGSVRVDRTGKVAIHSFTNMSFSIYVHFYKFSKFLNLSNQISKVIPKILIYKWPVAEHGVNDCRYKRPLGERGVRWIQHAIVMNMCAIVMDTSNSHGFVCNSDGFECNSNEHECNCNGYKCNSNGYECNGIWIRVQ